MSHRPLTHINDTQISNLTDPAAANLWARHRVRLIASIGRLDLKWPDNGMVVRDRYALRHLALLLAVVALISANDAWLRRLDQAFTPNFSDLQDTHQIILEAWNTPPDYTGLPPISLSMAQNEEKSGELKIPPGSRLLVQAQGLPTSGMSGPAILVANDKKQDFAVLDVSTHRSETTLTSGQTISVLSGWSRGRR